MRAGAVIRSNTVHVLIKSLFQIIMHGMVWIQRKQQNNWSKIHELISLIAHKIGESFNIPLKHQLTQLLNNLQWHSTRKISITSCYFGTYLQIYVGFNCAFGLFKAFFGEQRVLVDFINDIMGFLKDIKLFCSATCFQAISGGQMSLEWVSTQILRDEIFEMILFIQSLLKNLLYFQISFLCEWWSQSFYLISTSLQYQNCPLFFSQQSVNVIFVQAHYFSFWPCDTISIS